jgi:hypothetical protein
MEDSNGAHRALVRKPEGKRPHRRPRRRYTDDINMYLQDMG